MGSAWADNDIKPKSAQIVIGVFCFFAGEINKALVKNKPPQHNSDFVIMIPQNEEWSKLIEEVYGENTKKITRYAIKKEPNIFDIKKLIAITEAVSKDYDIRLIDENIYDATKKMSGLRIFALNLKVMISTMKTDWVLLHYIMGSWSLEHLLIQCIVMG